MATSAAQRQHTRSAVADASDERVEWAKQMRLQFSPAGMLQPDGAIDQQFFRPKQVVIMHDAKKWGDAERELLYQGLERHGVGKWREIGEEFLSGWDDQQLRIKASRLLGTQSLARHVGWKGSRRAVEAEYAKHKRIGEATGCWKGGVLVEDDSGSVRKYLEQLAAAGGGA
jgi:hypothetical protein